MTSNPASPTRPAARGAQRRPDLESLYCINEDGSRNTIHPADVRGRFQRRKRLIQFVLVALWVVLPWIEIGGHPAILIDLPTRSFYLFGQTFNAQDFYLAYFLLTGVAFTLFVLSALWGRVWCGYACPHTVFLEGFYRRIERWLEGSVAQRKNLDASSWTLNKVLRRGSKWALFLLLSAFLAHNLLSYFMGAGHVLEAMTSPPSEHPTAFGFVLIVTGIVYFNFAWFREQTCIVVCPYGRLQGVLYDADTLNIAYDDRRGEPRDKYHAEERGDCIDCFRCVAVCPTGIDIRNGTQLECVGCANCIDACDEVMEKVGQAPGLIRYDSQRGIEEGRRRFIRPQVLLYGFLLLVGIVVFAVAASRRVPFEAKVIRPGTPYVADAETVRNVLILHVVNKQPRAHTFHVTTEDLPGVKVVAPRSMTALESLADDRLTFVVEIDRAAWRSGLELVFHIRSDDDALQQTLSVDLLGPRR